IAFVESKRIRGEDLDESDDRAFVADGCRGYGTNGETAADGGVDAGVDFGIITTQGFSCANALAGKSRTDIDVSSERWSADADAGAAHHGSAVDERDRGAAAAQQRAGTFTDDAQ